MRKPASLSPRKLLLLAVLAAVLIVAATLAIRDSDAMSRQLWDKTVSASITDLEIVPVRGWPLPFVAETPRGWKVLAFELAVDLLAAWLLAMFVLFGLQAARTRRQR